MAGQKGFQRRDTEKHMPPRNAFRPHPPARPSPGAGRAEPERAFWRELERRHERHARPEHAGPGTEGAT
jgi:hypothetical protein